MRFKRPQFSLKTLLILMFLAGMSCWFGARIVHRRTIANTPLVWTEVLPENSAELAKHKRAMVVVYAEWNVTAMVWLRALDRPPIRLALSDFQCVPLKLNITEQHAIDVLDKNFPEWKLRVGHALLVEDGKFVADLGIAGAEQELQKRYGMKWYYR